MARLTSIILALMVVLTLWMSASAHAADRVDVKPVAAGVGHFDGDSDQAPADQHDGVVHHHAPCGDQNAAALNDGPSAHPNVPVHARLAPGRFTRVQSRVPDADLRPPIA